MLLRGNKGKGREKGKMKKTEGYVVRRLEDEYLVLPSGRRTEDNIRFSFNFIKLLRWGGVSVNH